MKGKYITVLDFEVGRVFQYENLEHFKDGWNGNDKDDRENIEWYLTDIQGHRLSNIEWMLHDDKEIIEQNPHGENGILF
tara:strand:+ start:838 stop:1074 length:237 start_codon:yes stop_codon:yes gene_type:complete